MKLPAFASTREILTPAEKWYKIGHDTGLKEPDIKPAHQDMWNFRWEHAHVRIATRRGWG